MNSLLFLTQKKNKHSTATTTTMTTTETEKKSQEEALREARELRISGNARYARHEFAEAAELYTRAIDLIQQHCAPPPKPLPAPAPPAAIAAAAPAATPATEEEQQQQPQQERLGETEQEFVTLLSNRAACELAERQYEAVETDCNKALAYNPMHAKALWRRADAREALSKPREALEDLRALAKADAELGRSDSVMRGIARLEPLAKRQQEAEMAEMLGKLKSLGNSLLGRFGLSTDNFKIDKDPRTGSYSIRFEQGHQPQPSPQQQQQQQQEQPESEPEPEQPQQ